jgi:hypothetical protein
VLNVKALDLAKQAKVSEVLGPDFGLRTPHSGSQSMFGSMDSVAYEKTSERGAEEVNIGIEWSRDAVRTSFYFLIFITLHDFVTLHCSL